MKTYLKKALALSQTLLLFAGIAGCAGNSTEEYDETKYHLYISAYDAGYGRAWLEMYEKEFEERYTDYTFNDGSDKKGVDVHLDWNQLNAQGLITSMKGSQNQIYFNSVDYYDLVVSDNALDLTAILNEDMADVGEAGNTVLKKIPEDMKEYYGSVRKGKYYGVPSTETWDGINYDKDLFRTKRLYLASEWNDSVSVFTSGEEGDLPKSKGPDDIAGTYDDGLPATISQFYDLLNQMTNVAGVTPFTFSANLGYAEMLPMALWANFEGKEQMQLNFSLKGEAKDLITVSADGKVTQDAAPTAINDSNAYELTRQQGIYRALKVVEDLVDNNTGKSYFSNSAFAGDQDHIAAQEEYLYSAIEGSPIAFLVEGTYWTAEASGIFNDITNSYGEGDEYSVLSKKKSGYAYLFKTLSKLCDFNALKSRLEREIYAAYHRRAYDAMQKIVKQFGDLKRKELAFYNAFDKQWHLENKSVGFEIQNIRFGGVRQSLDYTEKRLRLWSEGKLEKIEELEEDRLPFDPNNVDLYDSFLPWTDIVSKNYICRQ